MSLERRIIGTVGELVDSLNGFQRLFLSENAPLVLQELADRDRMEEGFDESQNELNNDLNEHMMQLIRENPDMDVTITPTRNLHYEILQLEDQVSDLTRQLEEQRQRQVQVRTPADIQTEIDKWQEQANAAFDGERRQWAERIDTYQKIIDAASESVRSQKKIENDLRKTIQNSNTVALAKRAHFPPVTIGSDADELIKKLDNNVTKVSRDHEYRVAGIFRTIDANEGDLPVWKYFYDILKAAAGWKDAPEFSTRMLKIMLILVEGALRMIPDTAMDFGLQRVTERFEDEKTRYMDPLFVLDRNTHYSLQGLMHSNLTTLYRQRYDIMPTLSSQHLFKRYIPVTGLNTFRYDPNHAKTSIYIYTTDTLKELDELKEKYP